MSAPSLRDIMEFVAFHYGVTPEQIKGVSRLSYVMPARQMFCWVARQETRADGTRKWGFPEIGRACGGRDHATIQYSVRKTQKQIDDGEIQPLICPRRVYDEPVKIPGPIDESKLPKVVVWRRVVRHVPVPKRIEAPEPEAKKPSRKWTGPIPCPGTDEYNEWRRTVVERAA